MKRVFTALLLCVSLCLSGCSGLMTKNNITGLLSAPKFSQTENEIVKTIDNYIGENITLKYSQSQGYASPVQLIDINDDGVNEAVVFYYAPNKGSNIRIALLTDDGEKWNIVFDKEGMGSEVFYFNTARFPGLSTKQLLVGYLTANITENFFVTYFTDTDVPLDDYVGSCKDIIVGDVTYNGYSDVVLTNLASDGRIRLTSLSFTEDKSYKVVGTRLLRYPNIEITDLKLARSIDDEVVLYADYRDGYNHMHTEGVVFRDGGKMYDAFNDTVISRQWEYTDPLESFDIDKDDIMEVPSVIWESSEEPTPIKIVEWTDYARSEPVRKYIGFYDAQTDLFAAIPDEWQNNVHTVYAENRWQVVANEDSELFADKEDKLLVTVTQVEYRNDIETGAYSYMVYRNTKTWHFEFTKNVELSEIEYILSSVTDLR